MSVQKVTEPTAKGVRQTDLEVFIEQFRILDVPLTS
jgi:hypothetical protein